MKAGDTVTMRFTAREEDGTLINITNMAIVWQMAREGSPNALLVKSTTNSTVNITDGANGKFEVELTPEETVDLIGDYYHEAKVVEWPKLWTVYSGTVAFEKAMPLPDDVIAALNA